MAFWVCTASAGLTLCISPFLTIGTQGNTVKGEQCESFGGVGDTTGTTPELNSVKKDRYLDRGLDI